MYILAIDTTAKTAAASVCEAVENEVNPICDCRLNATLTHSESILPMIDFCLKNARVDLMEVDVLAVSAGPGSFTGVRIGVATIKGLGFANENVKCVAISALEALSANADDETKGTIICPCMDARRQQVYNALFVCDGKGSIKRLCEDRAISISDLYDELNEKYSKKRIVLVGDGAKLSIKAMSQMDGFENMKISLVRSDRLLQDASSVARVAFKHLDEAVDCNSLNPTYLRLSQAERERNERMGK